MATELIHRLRIPGEDYIEPVYTTINIRYGITRRIWSLYVGAIDGTPEYYNALDDDAPHLEYWDETEDNAYISAPFTAPITGQFPLPINGIDIVQHLEGIGTFRSDSPHAGEHWYHKGYWANLRKVAGDNVYLEEGKEYYVITKDRSLLNNLSLQIHTSDIDTSIIDEPIGWDDLKMSMKRNDYHGMGAEVSLGELEFYGKAFNTIKDAYDEDIDATVIYSIKTDDDTTIYSGQVDLTTCSFVKGDYLSVKAKVGEVGLMTTFNNRTKTEIDLTEPKTVDGEDVTIPTWRSIHIPLKHLLYTNRSKQKTDATITTSGGHNPYPDTGIWIACGGGYNYPYIFLPIGVATTNEFGTFEQANPYTTDDISDVEPQYVASSDHESRFGSNTKVQVRIVLNATLTRTGGAWTPVGQNYIRWHLEARDYNGKVISGPEKKVYKPDVNFIGATWDLSCELEGELNAGGSVKYYIKFDIDLGTASSQSFYAHIQIHKGSFVEMTMHDNRAETDPVYADMLLTHDALNVVASAISENGLSVKSDWYRTPESYLNSGTTGGGACKALTNGYHIRGLFTDGELKRNMPLSFKALIESLDALDCIGWGFSTEDDAIFVRVERWDWFYKDTTILTLTNVAEVTTEVYTDYIPTELKIGYKKYATQDQYNSIDSPHGSRTFTNGIKALSKALTKECEFVADNYAIEETRRARNDVNETEETTYDESIFVFELVRQAPYVAIGETPTPPSYTIVHSATAASNVGLASEFINAKLTPRHMAARWRAFLFSTNNTTPFRFTAGEINYKSSFKTVPENTLHQLIGATYLQSFAVKAPQVENDDISYSHAKFKAEKITFQCPLSIAQYKTVKANPYGLVSVNGVLGWIMDFKYSLHDGLADFTLIAKYVTQS